MSNEIFAEGSFCIYGNEAAMFYDMHRDAYGYRPKFSDYVFPSFEKKSIAFKEMEHAVCRAEKHAAQAADAAYNAWIVEVHAIANKTNASVSDVIRWQFEANGLNVERRFDRGHFCYINGFDHEMGKLIIKTQRE